MTDERKLQSDIDNLREIPNKVEEENKVLKWFITTITDVLNYNEYDKIDLDLILKCCQDVEDCDNFTRTDLAKIHFSILESGLATLPTTEKAIRKFGK